jgi:prepilin-type N-terminal cleavage/methylation domain-containing protein
LDTNLSFAGPCRARRAGAAGFTLIELLVVIGIVAILSAIGIPAYNGYTADSRRASANNSLRNIYLAQLDFRSQTGAFFDSDGAAGGCTAALVSAVPGVDDSVVIVNNLFAGADVVSVFGYGFCVEGGAAFTAWASNGTTTCGINQNNQIIDAANAVVGQC